jgi:glucosamine-6-phosphate deaminase
MNIHVLPDIDALARAAADCLVEWFEDSRVRNLMVAGGNTPLPIYRNIASRGLDLTHLNVFPLDEYVGVPIDDPRTCSNLLCRQVAEAWRIPPTQFFPLSSLECDAQTCIDNHESIIREMGGLDVIVLGLGQNGHLGFNEPGSAPDSPGRVVQLESLSIEANRRWFDGAHAPDRGVTTGLKTILAARHVLIMAHGREKAAAVHGMTCGPVGAWCPASFLQNHPDTHLFVDGTAAGDSKIACNPRRSIGPV